MRTLKKTLALVLVLAMMFSLCITASADFTDTDEITYTEAADLLAGLGVIEGMPDGSFDAKGTLTRAQAAVIITRMLDAEDYAIATAGQFTDVAANHWAAGAISFCVDAGIVAGYGDGTFGPSDTLTGYQWAKMLLCALGYSADAEGMTGAAWQINVAKLAKAADLFKGNEKADKTAAATREEAALYAFNTLWAACQEYTGGTSFTVAGITFTSGGTREATGKTFAKTYFADLTKVTDKVDDYGLVYTAYTNGKTGTKEVVYSTVVPEPVYSTTTALTAAGLAKALGKKAVVDVDLPAGGNGTLINLYATETADTYTSIIIPTYAYELVEADIVEADAEKEIKAGIEIDGMKYDTEDTYKEGDVVIYTLNAAGDDVVTAAKAKAVSGYVTATASTYFRVNGDKYEYAANCELDKLSVDAEQEYTFYLDEYGYVIYYVEGKLAEVETNYVYVVAKAAKAAETTAGDLFESATASAAAVQYKVMDLATGEISLVDGAIVKDKDGAYWYADKFGEATDVAVADIKAAPVNAYYEYAVLEDGSYVLIGTVEAEEVELVKGQADIGDYRATSKTTVTYIEYTKDKSGYVTETSVTTKTGIANFPAEDKTNGNTYTALVVADKGVASSLVIMTEKEEPAVPVNYAIFAGVGETSAAGTAYSYIIDGEAKDYYFAKDAEVVVPTKGDVVALTLVSGKIADADVLTPATGTISAIDETYMVVGSEVVYFAASYAVVNETDDYAADKIAAKDYIEYYVNDKGAVEFIVITEAPKEA